MSPSAAPGASAPDSSIDAAGPDSSPVEGLTVLIVGINYWPEPTGIAPYTTAVAEHLAERGAFVEVLTGLPSYPSWTVPERYKRGWRFREPRNGVRVTRLKHAVPHRQDALRRACYEFSFLAHVLAARPTRRPDVVVGITPALGGAVAAGRIARRYRSRLVLVVQDLLGAAASQSGIAGGTKVATAVRRLESQALRQADAVVVVADAFRRQLEAYGVPPSRLSTIRNWAHVAVPRGDRAQTRDSLGWGPDLKVALHTGNMGLKQDLGNIVEAARLSAERPDLRWVLMGEGSQKAALVEQAAGLTNLQILPLCSSDEYAGILAASDVLLLNERAGVTDMSLPSKLTSYFMSGRPVVAAVPPGGSSAAELARAGAPSPVAPGNAAELVAAVSRICASPEQADRCGRAAFDYAQKHLTREAGLAMFESVLAGAHR